MTDNEAQDLVEQGLTPVYVSPGYNTPVGEKRFAPADVRTMIQRAEAAGFFVIAVSGCLLISGGGIMEPLDMIHDGSRDLNWPFKRQALNDAALRFIDRLEELGASGASIDVVAHRR